jgi:glycosyltransferase involved in cell wall biosynthesis
MEKIDNPLWLVIDARTAQDGVNSGISRFIMCLAGAIVEELSVASSLGRSAPPLKVLLVGKHEPPSWIVDLVHQNPKIVSFWSGGPGALSQKWDKPVFGWPTLVVKRIQKLTRNNFLWLAPANFDRPLFSTLLGFERSRVIQIVHDTIPFVQKKSVGFFFRTQFRMLTRRALAKCPLVCTVSSHAAAELLKVYPKRTNPILVLRNGVGKNFGNRHRPRNVDEKRKVREEFLLSVFPELRKDSQASLLHELVFAHWILGVGRTQRYKCWDVGQDAVKLCNSQRKERTLYIRVGGGVREYAQEKPERTSWERGALIPQLSTLILPQVDDLELSELYRISDVLVHPSVAEGFGLPPFEAAHSGLPVLFRAQTAVEEHFPAQALPTSFWKGVEGDSPEVWAAELSRMIDGDEARTKFWADMSQAANPREFLARKVQGNPTGWNEAARTLLRGVLGMPDLKVLPGGGMAS